MKGVHVLTKRELICFFALMRLTRILRSLLTITVRQGPRNDRFIVGVSFDEKIYISKQVDDYGILEFINRCDKAPPMGSALYGVLPTGGAICFVIILFYRDKLL